MIVYSFSRLKVCLMFSLLQLSNEHLVIAQASTGDSNTLIGWILVLVLAAIFVGFIVSIFRTKPIDLEDSPKEEGNDSKPEVESETKLVVTKEVETVNSEVAAIAVSREKSEATSVVAAPKVKGLKGKKKLQKKKINAFRASSNASQEASNEAKDATTGYQPRVAEYKANQPVSVLSNTSDSPENVSAEVEKSTEATGDSVPAMEPVAPLASTYVINAMANKPRANAKPKDSSEKTASSKNSVQGFHKMDRYREPIRVVDAPIVTPTVTRVDPQAASVGGEAEKPRKDDRRNRKPKRETTKIAPTEAEGPRTLKDFLAKKTDEE
jgi:hypothetical protein